MTIVFFLIAVAIAFFMLRKTGGGARHLLAFVVGAAVAGLLGLLYFQLLYPLGAPGRNQVMAAYTVITIAAAVLGPIVGIVVAMFVRRRRGA